MPITNNRIGTTNTTVTNLGFGGAPIGAVGDRLPEETAAQIIASAYNSGIRYFDVAPLYGHGLSEKRLGAVLSEHPRDQFTLSTKTGRLLTAAGQRDPNMRDNELVGVEYDYSYGATRRSLEASLARLGLDRVDILLCHDIDTWTHGDAQPAILKTAMQGMLPALTDMRSDGIIGAFGLGVNEWQVCSQIMTAFDVDCFLLAGRFTLLEQEPLQSLLPECCERQVSVIVGGPYNSGLLAQSQRRKATYDYQPVDDARWNKALRIRAVCDQFNIDMRAAALQYPLQHPAVASVIPGVWSMAEVETNIELLDVEIPAALWEALDAEQLAIRIQ